MTRVTPLAAAAKRVQLDPNTLGPKSSAVSPTGGEGIVGKVTRSNLLLIKADEAPAVANSATPITRYDQRKYFLNIFGEATCTFDGGGASLSLPLFWNRRFEGKSKGVFW